MKKLDIIYLADCIISHFSQKGDFISNKKLQKLLYYIQAWHLVYFDKNLFDDKPEAWAHGPVYPVAYHKYKKFGANPLKPVDFDFTEPDVFTQLDIKKEQVELVKSVLVKYGSISAYQLELISHSEQPWLEKRKGFSDFAISSEAISFSTMKSFYEKLLKN